MRRKTPMIFGAVASAVLATSGFAQHAQAQSPIVSVGADPSGCSNVSVVPGTQPVSCDVSPYTAWYTGVAADGTGVYLDCAWKPGAGRPQFDESYSEIAQRNDRLQFAKRIQHVNGVWVTTKATDLNGGSTIIESKLEAFTSAGEIATKQCTIDTDSDTRTNCKSSDPIVTDVNAAISYGQKVEGFCRNYVKLLGIGGSITNDYYDPKRAQAWFSKQSQYVQALKK